MNNPRHILKLSCGITCEMTVDEETGHFDCTWSRRPTKELLPKILPEYTPWRNSILEDWAQRSGKKLLLIDL